METAEQRIAVLEQLLLEQHAYFSILLNLLIRSDDKLRIAVAESIRLMLQNKVDTHPIPLSVQHLLRSLRDELLLDPIPELTATLASPPVRPV